MPEMAVVKASGTKVKGKKRSGSGKWKGRKSPAPLQIFNLREIEYTRVKLAKKGVLASAEYMAASNEVRKEMLKTSKSNVKAALLVPPTSAIKY